MSHLPCCILSSWPHACLVACPLLCPPSPAPPALLLPPWPPHRWTNPPMLSIAGGGSDPFCGCSPEEPTSKEGSAPDEPATNAVAPGTGSGAGVVDRVACPTTNGSSEQPGTNDQAKASNVGGGSGNGERMSSAVSLVLLLAPWPYAASVSPRWSLEACPPPPV